MARTQQLVRIKVGTVNGDIFRGSALRDQFFGMLGNDSLYGGRGDDLLAGHDGNDKLYGGPGDDILRGGNGADSLYGGPGRDELTGDDGDDYLQGDAGDDWIYAGLGNDTVVGGAGNDYFEGNDGNDKMDGGNGNDSIYAGVGTDQIVGGAGDDYLDGGNDLDEDLLSCSAGNDSAAISARDIALGGAGYDTLIVRTGLSSTGASLLDLSQIHSSEAANIGLSGARAGQFERADVAITIGSEGCSVKGSQGDDRIFTSDDFTQGLSIDAGEGNDEIWASSGNIVTGGAGSDAFGIDFDNDDDFTIVDFEATDFIYVRDLDERTDEFNLAVPVVVGTDPVADSAKGQFLYDTDDGRLLYDPDGTGAIAARLILTLSNKFALTSAYFIIDL